MGGRNGGQKDQILISGISYSNFDCDGFEGFKTYGQVPSSTD
jgi:hypothetical protein